MKRAYAYVDDAYQLLTDSLNRRSRGIAPERLRGGKYFVRLNLSNFQIQYITFFLFSFPFLFFFFNALASLKTTMVNLGPLVRYIMIFTKRKRRPIVEP